MLWDICEGNLGEDAGANMLSDNKESEKETLIERDELPSDDDDVEMEEVQSDDSEDFAEDMDGDQSDMEEDEVEQSKYIEDIYGRTIDAKTGKIVKGVDTSKAQQKLEQLNEESELTDEKRQALTKSIRSILNRSVLTSFCC